MPLTQKNLKSISVEAFDLRLDRSAKASNEWPYGIQSTWNLAFEITMQACRINGLSPSA